MFGEKTNYIEKKAKVDDKNRFSLPAELKAEVTDRLVFLNEKSYIEVWNEKEFNEKLSKGSKIVKEQMIMKSFDVSSPDKQGRIFVPGIRTLLDLSTTDYIIVKGTGTTARLYREDVFEKEKVKILSQQV